jgi:hypothetical protein
MSFIGDVLGTNSHYEAEQSLDREGEFKRNRTARDQTYHQQERLNDMLRTQAQFGSALAQAQLRQATDQNIAQQTGFLASQKGLNPALAGRLASQQGSHANQEAANQSAILQAQTQQAGQQGLFNNLQVQGNQALGYSQNLQQAQTANNQINAGTASGNAGNQAQTAGAVIKGGADVIAAGQKAKPPIGASQGGEIQGRAQVAGDSRENDTVPTMLSPGEIVIPRTKSHDPELAKEFIDHLMRDGYAQGGEVKEPKSYGSVLAAQRKLESRLAQLEKRLGGHHARE